jgi:hypothetical protein
MGTQRCWVPWSFDTVKTLATLGSSKAELPNSKQLDAFDFPNYAAEPGQSFAKRNSKQLGLAELPNSKELDAIEFPVSRIAASSHRI